MKGWTSSSVDPDMTAHHEPSDLDLCCLQKPIIIAYGSERVSYICFTMIFQKRLMRTEHIFVILSRIRIKCKVLHMQNLFHLPPHTIFLLTVPRFILCCSYFVYRGFIWCVCLVIGCSSFLPPCLGMFVFRNCGISSVFILYVCFVRAI